jgi:glycine C-acetyltransferase/8-amino-7-oxononanoate synthase
MYVMESAPGARTRVNGREVDYFCGTGYFGLQGHPELLHAVCEYTKKYGIGTATSRFGYGDNPVLLEVEEMAARFFGQEDALYFVSGYLGNAVLLQGLRDNYDMIFIDEDSHYSVFDGAYTAQKPVIRFGHLDAQGLSEKLKQHLKPRQKPLLICDGVFPVSGEISPLADYISILDEYDDYLLCVDDAHATGVIGEHGKGTLEYFGLTRDRTYTSYTLSKAVGGYGGIVAGKREFIAYLRESSEIFHGASPVPTPAAAASVKGLKILTNQPELRRTLWENVAYAKQGLRELGFDIPDTPVPIICLHREDIDPKNVQSQLFESGIAVLFAAGGSYSSVPEGGAIRIAIFSTHTREQIDRLVDTIRGLIE